MKSFNEQMATIYVDYYNKNGEDKAFEFVLKNHVSMSVLTSLYDAFIKGNEVEDITKIPKEKKDKYWQIACKYFTELPDRLKASKASYALELITANF